LLQLHQPAALTWRFLRVRQGGKQPRRQKNAVVDPPVTPPVLGVWTSTLYGLYPGMKTERITHITDIIFIFIFLIGFGFKYGLC
jgi:hypothetical protein